MKLEENVLDPIQPSLNPLLFNSQENVKQGVVDAIIKVVYSIIEKNRVVGIYFVGSSTGYQYNSASDIDIHVWVANLSETESEDLYEKFPKNLFFQTHPIQFYVEEREEFSDSKGSVYDLLKSEWVIKPKQEFVQVPFEYVLEVSRGFMAYIDTQITSYESTALEYSRLFDDNSSKELLNAKLLEMKASLDSLYILKDMMYRLRSGGYQGEMFNLFIPFSKGNYSIQNMIYKMLERTGYLAKLKKYSQLRHGLK